MTVAPTKLIAVPDIQKEKFLPIIPVVTSVRARACVRACACVRVHACVRICRRAPQRLLCDCLTAQRRRACVL